mmetsp:Transcript_46093/g.105049  ORF Transcript_46093/g.105049 Transcript_46093/m.105049 type:complete len:191 (-) Transcript_46093:63-635(-)
MALRTEAEYAGLIAGIDEGFRAIQARLKPVALAHEAGVSAPPTAARIRDTKMKNRPDPAAGWSGLAGSAPSRRRVSLPSPEADNVDATQLRQRSALRRASPERRISLAGISWSKDIEATIPAPAQVLKWSKDIDAARDSDFMARVQTAPPLRPCSPAPFDVTATAASCAAASRAGVKLAMENSVKLRNRF